MIFLKVLHVVQFLVKENLELNQRTIDNYFYSLLSLLMQIFTNATEDCSETACMTHLVLQDS